MKNDRIKNLAEIFVEYEMYSRDKYTNEYCPLRIFQKEYPDDPYFKEIEVFLNKQREKSEAEGADLPWWGKHYFAEDIGVRVMILGNKTKSSGGGSVTFYMPLLKDLDGQQKLEDMVKEYKEWDKFKSFKRMKKFLSKCNLDYDFVYVSDAKKIDCEWEYLLEREIEIVKPDIIICFGDTSIKHLLNDKNIKITELIDNDKIEWKINDKIEIDISEEHVLIASLSPAAGNGHYTDFREEKVVGIVKRNLKNKDS